MKRLAVLIFFAGLAGTALATEPAMCKSICASEKSSCRAEAQEKETTEGLLLSNADDKNTMARTAQLQMRSDDGGGIGQSGFQHRRMTKVGVCEDSFQRCTRSCNASDNKPGAKAG